jgi:hypothetical protein
MRIGRPLTGTIRRVSAPDGAPPPGQGAGETVTVLVVEDDAALCFPLEQGLLGEGFDVLVATDAGTSTYRRRKVSAEAPFPL